MNGLPIRKIVTLAIGSLMVIGVVIGGISQLTDYYNSLDSSNPPARRDSEYTDLITEKFPDMDHPSVKTPFTIVAADELQDNWYRVTIENPHNQDKLYTLVYDPKNGAEFMRLILPPSVRFTPEENLTNLPIPQSVMEKMNGT